MSLPGRIKRVFPGGNTAQGFYSFYDNIIPVDAKRIFIIKGGPGVGKSSFMKAIAAEMVEKGHNVEIHHCSSDNDSIDGLVIAALNIALIDGTAPHVVDPRNPGCVDEILHLGDYWNEKGIIAHKEEILNVNKEVRRLFTQAYRFLNAASILKKDIAAMYEEAQDQGFLNQQIDKIISDFFSGMDIAANPGKIRHLFASAISPDGCINYLDTVLGQAQKLFLIKGEPGTGQHKLLSMIADAATRHGFNVEAYHCSLDPEYIEHLYIPDLSIALTTPSNPQNLNLDSAETIDLDSRLNPVLLHKFHGTLPAEEELFRMLLNKATDFISQAKQAHDKMETYYIPYMDFTAITELRKKTLQRILNYT